MVSWPHWISPLVENIGVEPMTFPHTLSEAEGCGTR